MASSLWFVTVQKPVTSCYGEQFTRYKVAVVSASSKEDACARFISTNTLCNEYEITAVPYVIGEWIEVDDDMYPHNF